MFSPGLRETEWEMSWAASLSRRGSCMVSEWKEIGERMEWSETSAGPGDPGEGRWDESGDGSGFVQRGMGVWRA